MNETSDEMRPEYDFRKLKFVGRGIYAKRFRSGTNLIIVEHEGSQQSARDVTEESLNGPLVFSVVEDDGENVTIEISEEDYQRDLAAGIDEDSILKPGRYKMKRCGFLAPHPELKIE